MRALKILGLAILMACLAAGCASSSKRNKFDQAAYDYSAAIRWGDFEGAWTMVDPEYRKQHPITDLQLERYKQIQISAYRDLATQTLPDGGVLREIYIGVINKHDMSERSIRYTERWRYDAEHKTWLLTVGLPDLWAGE
ncbi:hypothetical protein [Luteimonas aquatica]|uniref:hypothetical protein n=1 Tax=Luteimonas aquatica TaxID=450364 RepID=UPI001F594792|nr:hypothetical protein [Luteimonas aquatica]